MYALGEVAHLTCTITDESGDPLDPGALTLSIYLPDQTTVVVATSVSSPAVVRDGPGLYHVDYPTTQSGYHVARWVGTGANATALLDVFNVGDVLDGVTLPLVSMADAKDQLNIPQSTTSYDAALRIFIAAVTPVIEQIAGKITPTTYDEWYDGGSPKIVLDHTPVISVSSVTETFGSNTLHVLSEQPLDGMTAVNAYGYTVKLITGTITRRVSGVAAPFAAGVDNVNVVYLAGRTVIPANILQAARELIRINWQPKQVGARGGRAGAQGIDQMQVDGTVRMGFFVPNRVAELLSPEMNDWGIA